jgi:hypothetical protein
VVLALLFPAGAGCAAAPQVLEFFTGYLVKKSLSVADIFNAART